MKKFALAEAETFLSLTAIEVYWKVVIKCTGQKPWSVIKITCGEDTLGVLTKYLSSRWETLVVLRSSALGEEDVVIFWRT